MNNRRQFLATSLLAAASWPGRAAGPIETFVAIQNVCAWPKLLRLPEGGLVALVFNQPCHGLWEGDVECWASSDNGRTWARRSQLTQHEPGTVRMNCSFGFAKNGDLVAVVGGWSGRGPVGKVLPGAERRLLRPWVCRSSDGGATWTVRKEFPDPPQTGIGVDNAYLPFGQIHAAEDGVLTLAAYLVRSDQRVAYFLRSHDDGQTWGDISVLNPIGNETATLHLGGGRWIAASRQFRLPGQPDAHLVQLDSNDDGRTWTAGAPLTLHRQIPGHLLRLRDGRILLTYGNRNWNNCGVDARISRDEGRTWGTPFRLAHLPRADCGYPSCVQLPDGRVVTAFYTQISHHYHYEMRVARWNADATDCGELGRCPW